MWKKAFKVQYLWNLNFPGCDLSNFISTNLVFEKYRGMGQTEFWKIHPYLLRPKNLELYWMTFPENYEIKSYSCSLITELKSLTDQLFCIFRPPNARDSRNPRNRTFWFPVISSKVHLSRLIFGREIENKNWNFVEVKTAGLNLSA